MILFLYTEIDESRSCSAISRVLWSVLLFKSSTWRLFAS